LLAQGPPNLTCPTHVRRGKPADDMRSRPLAAFFLVALAAMALGWGDAGHRLISNRAVDAMTTPPGKFFKANRAWLSAHASDPDHARRGDKAEGPRHFLDLDEFVSSPFKVGVTKRDDWERKYGDRAFKYGEVPWAIADRYALLVKAFKAKNRDDILMNAAWMGHYLADVHMPFHAVKDYDGKAAGQAGIHAFVESDVAGAYVSEGDVVAKAGPAEKLVPEKVAFEALAESAAMVPDMLKWDKAANRDMAAFAKLGKAAIVSRMTKAASRLASLWTSAWIEAGKPSLP
jgi:hypothetical protein